MGIIFDLDGTLINTLYDLGNSCNRTLEKFGYPVHTLDAYRYFVGNGMKTLMIRALPQDFNGDFENVLEVFLEDYEKNHSVDSKVYDGVIETLKELNSLQIPIAICTNKKQEYTDSIVSHFLGDINFVAQIGDQFDGLHKPNPTHALRIADMMGIQPQDIFFVGDSNVDMITARNANMIPIAVSWGFRPVAELIEHGAQKVIDSMKEIVVEVKRKKC